MSVSVNPPKTPVTKGSNGIAAATIPNICKMPGPPAPFIPTPLPNIGKSGKSPDGYSKNVKFEGKEVAIKGASFKSMGDIASKGTGGGLISANTEGPTKFVGPGSMDVKVEGKNVQLLSDPMLNNCGGSGSPPNAATLVGVLQETGLAALSGDEPCPICDSEHKNVKLEETPDTQSAAKALRTAAGDAVAAAKTENRKRGAQARMDEKVFLFAMLGVVHCNNGKIYAGKSSYQVKELSDAMEKGWHTPVTEFSLLQKPAKSSHDPMTKFTDKFLDEARKKKFTDAWNYGKKKHEQYKKDRKKKISTEPFHQPGHCAAQQLIVLALDHETQPDGLTEIIYDSRGPVKAVAAFRVLKDGVPQAPELGEFGGDNAVPPCGTCQIILTALMCPEEKRTNSWKKPTKKGVCNCNP